VFEAVGSRTEQTMVAIMVDVRRALSSRRMRNEFERYLVWWTKYECVSHHLGHILVLEPESPLVSEIKTVQIKTVHSVKATLRILRHWTLLNEDTNRDKTR